MQKLHWKCRADIVSWNKGFKDLDPLNSMLALSGSRVTTNWAPAVDSCIESPIITISKIKHNPEVSDLRSQNPETK